ncbi:predicted protein [Streptomyces sp. AA4]|nr:predicted protein [Streptomyces sp. AA4]
MGAGAAAAIPSLAGRLPRAEWPGFSPTAARTGAAQAVHPRTPAKPNLQGAFCLVERLGAHDAAQVVRPPARMPSHSTVVPLAFRPPVRWRGARRARWRGRAGRARR